MPLPLDKQTEIRRNLQRNPKATEMLMQAVADGILDTENVYRWKLDIAAFRTQDADMLRLVDMAVRLAPREEPVLVTGESGTGKELIANILHGGRLGAMVAVNTCAVSEQLFESELFGHVKGAFTGSIVDRDGYIHAAKDGTLFLDEIGDLSLHLQSKLLRVIQHRTYRKVGSNRDEEVRCRIVAATHQDLMGMIRGKQFRLDLYERLNVFNLHIKPLRERLIDVGLFVKDDLQLHFRKLLMDNVEQPNSLGEALKQYSITKREIVILFSGNVRQLLNLKLRAEVLGIDTITEKDLL